MFLRLVVVVPDEQTYASEGQQKLEGYDKNVCHNSYVLTVTGSVIWRTPNC